MNKPPDAKRGKMSKSDRFAQMTQQERLIEEKKREIQNKLEARRRQNLEESKRENETNPNPSPVASENSPSIPNIFSNDGSFLEQFKQLKEKKTDSKSKSLKFSDRNRWNKALSNQSSLNLKPMRFSMEKQQITITTKTTFPSKNQPSSVDTPVDTPKIEAHDEPIISESKPILTENKPILSEDKPIINENKPNLSESKQNQPEEVTQQVSVQQSNTTIYHNSTINVESPQVLFNPPPVQTIQPQFSATQPEFNQNQPQMQPSTQIFQQLNTLPPQINQIQQPLQVLNAQNQEITVQQLVTPQTQIYQPLQMQQATTVQQVQLQTIQGTEGSLGLIQQPIGNQQVLLNVPSPQLVQTQLTNIVLTSQAQNVLVTAPNTVHLTTVTLPQQVLPGQTVELASIPPPNPIQVQNIPQPEPLNTMNIPQPAPLQVQNIPTPTTLHMNQIPDPKPLDLLAIPTPNSGHDFLRNIPPPNRNIPPPHSGMQFMSKASTLPSQEVLIHSITPSNQIQQNLSQIQGPPATSNIQIQASQQGILTSQGQIQVQGQIQIPSSVQGVSQMPQMPVPHPNSIRGPGQGPNIIQEHTSMPTMVPGPIPPPNMIQNEIQGLPMQNPARMLPQHSPSISPTQMHSNQPPPFQNHPNSGAIPSLMSQKVLPPPGMEMNHPPPPMGNHPPPSMVNHPPPPMGNHPPPPMGNHPPPPMGNHPPPTMGNHPPPPMGRHPPHPGFDQRGRMPSMNVPPPTGNIGPEREQFGSNMDEFFSPGTPKFEAMASLARMVVDCGPSIEEVVKEKKNRDPNLWFLFHPESRAYAQYQDLIKQHQREKDEATRRSERDRSYEREPRYGREDREFERGQHYRREDRDFEREQNYRREEREFERELHYRRGEREFEREQRYERDQDSDNEQRYEREHHYDREQESNKEQRYDRKHRYDRERQYDREEPYERNRGYGREQDIDWQNERGRRSSEASEVKLDPNDEPYEPEMALPDDEPYEPEMALQDDDDDKFDIKQEIKQENDDSDSKSERRRKRKSRWGEKDPNVQPPAVVPVVIPTLSHMMPISDHQPVPMLSKVTRTDPGLMQYVMTNYGSINLEEETWKNAEENYKIHLLYQDMMKKRAEVEKLAAQGKNKYEYDSDEETEGGTWEHKLRQKEMLATEKWSTELTKQSEGKHHIGDFLPPEELKRFMENCNAIKEGRQPDFSDYKEFKIKEDNVGFKMLQKLGWSEGQGLGQNSTGIVEPINKGPPRADTQGLGLNSEFATEGQDEYETYRKRMMLAYRFRPNPLNNPRRPYY